MEIYQAYQISPLLAVNVMQCRIQCFFSLKNEDERKRRRVEYIKHFSLSLRRTSGEAQSGREKNASDAKGKVSFWNAVLHLGNSSEEKKLETFFGAFGSIKTKDENCRRFSMEFTFAGMFHCSPLFWVPIVSSLLWYALCIVEIYANIERYLVSPMLNMRNLIFFCKISI